MRYLKDQDTANDIRMAVRQTLRKAKRPSPNLEQKQREALSNLTNDSSIVILPADKGNSTVLMDRETYDNKINTILNEGNYSAVRRDPTEGIERRIRKKLRSLVQKQEINMDLYRRLRPEHCHALLVWRSHCAELSQTTKLRDLKTGCIVTNCMTSNTMSTQTYFR